MVGMTHVDMRKLPAADQEERRRQGIGLRQRGLTCAAIAARVGLSQAVCPNRPCASEATSDTNLSATPHEPSQ